MVDHRTRLTALVAALIAALAALALGRWLGADDATMRLIMEIGGGIFTMLGVIDAAVVERRRRNPRIPALPDDRVGGLTEPRPVEREREEDPDVPTSRHGIPRDRRTRPPS